MTPATTLCVTLLGATLTLLIAVIIITRKQLMTRQQMLLTILIEECNETAQRASKAIRFGLEEVQEGQDLNNAQRLIYEFNDIVGVMEMLSGENIIPYHMDGVASGLKKLKIDKWLRFSEECGTLTPDISNK